MNSSYYIYRSNPRDISKGSALQLEWNHKTMHCFLTIANQSNEKRNDMYMFRWSEAKPFKLDINDLGQILVVLQGKATNINDGSGLFHQTKTGNSILKVGWSQGKLFFNFSSKTGGDLVSNSVGVTLSEAAILEVIVKDLILRYFDKPSMSEYQKDIEV